MRKRIVSWLLAISLSVTCLMPSIPAYAAEYASESASAEGSEKVSGTDGASAEISVNGEEDSIENDDTIIDEKKEENDEAGKEAGTESEGEPSKEPATEAATEATTAEDAAIDEASEEVSLEEAADAASSADSIVEEEEELTTDGADDPDITKNEIGFINTKELRAVTVKSKKVGIDVDIYVSTKEDKSDAEKIDTVYIGKAMSEYTASMSETQEQLYLKANVSDIITGDKRIEKSGTFYIFARFMTGEGADGYVESGCIIYHNTPGKGPVIESSIPASSRLATDGSVTFEKSENYYKKLKVEKYGSGDPLGYYILSEKATADRLAAGRYCACFSDVGKDDEGWFIDDIYADSEWTEFTVESGNYAEALTVYNYDDLTSGVVPETLIKGASLRLVGYVFPKNVYDSGVTFISSDPKVISIDANGNLKALKAPGKATITVTTKALDKDGNAIKKEYEIETVNEAPLKIKSAKFEQKSYKFDYVKDKDKDITLSIKLDKDAKCPVYWDVENTNVIKNSTNSSYTNEGETHQDLNIIGPGKTTVTANIGNVKTVSCTVTVEGTTDIKSKPYYYNGKFLTGFWAFNETTGLPVASGNAALKKTNAFVKYYDPMTLCPMSGIIRSGNKIYYADDSDCNIIRGNSNKDGKSVSGAVINKLGEFQLGWLKADGADQEYYYDPARYGRMATEKWVPRGNSYTYVDGAGLMRDTKGEPLSIDGLHTIDVDVFYFKGGLRQSGFIYLAADGTVTKQNKASWAYYFEPGLGYLVKDEFFWVGGKKYYADENGKILLNTRFVDSAGETYQADKSGAIYFGGKLFTVDGNTFYADEKGRIAFNTEILINGRVYVINGNGYVDASKEGRASEKFIYKEGGADKPAYVKASNAKKISSGTFLYKDEDCKQKLTSTWIYYSGTNDEYYLDNKGNFVVGPYQTDKGWYFFDTETFKAKKTGETHIASYKGKYYAVAEGLICTETEGFIKLDTVTYAHAKNNKGELMTGLQTIEGHKYFFTSDARLEYSYAHVSFSGDSKGYKGYLLNTEESYDIKNPKTWYIQTLSSLTVYEGHLINKDGSVVISGWGTVDGKKYYAYFGELLNNEDGIVKIGGKYYTFGKDYALLTGWQKIYSPRFVDIAAYTSKKYTSEHYFFFDEKTGALQTGWKTINALAVDSIGKVLTYYGELVVTNNKKKLYFNAASTDTLPLGALVRNTDMSVGGKLYRFSGDGSIISGKEGFEYVNNTDASIDALSAYRKKDGTMARGRTFVNTGKIKGYFYFSQATGKKETYVIRKCGNKWYYFGNNGMQDTTAIMYSEDFSGAYKAVYNKDGSIKGFIDAINGISVKNRVIRSLGGELYFIGSNGLPMTGLANDPDTGTKFYVEADGRNFCGYNAYPNEADRVYRLIKVGSKYYMLRNGIVLDEKNVIFSSPYVEQPNPAEDYIGFMMDDDDKFLEVFSLLPDADRKMAVRMHEAGNMAYGDDAVNYIMLNSDGSAISGKFQAMGMTMRMTKFGLAKDTCSLFVKNGSWMLSTYITSRISGQCYRVPVSRLEVIIGMMPGERNTELRFNFDKNGKITTIEDASTGKPANGIFVSNDHYSSFVIKLKNGKIDTSDSSISMKGMTIKLSVDKETGMVLKTPLGK